MKLAEKTLDKYYKVFKECIRQNGDEFHLSLEVYNDSIMISARPKSKEQ